ncbi:Ig-like domain-containing protein [Desulfofundulus salinus]|uniref:Ig-like domain-containing protein n=1 Tax=Desulfofundulus salinus TaxID=2419843 RepID=UPI001FA95A65|nr:Ig-like domain-containing protein [Desulfofundulus salinum]
MGKSKFFISRKAGRKAVSVLALLAMLLTLLPAVPAMAGQVGSVSVTAGNPTAGAAGVSYTVAFTATSGLEPGDEITVVFPTGYDVTNASVTGITYDGKTYQPAGTSLGNIVRIGIPAELTVSAGGKVTVEFSGVNNPTKAGNYQFAVRTTVDTTTAYGSVTIEPAAAAKIVITEPQNGAKFVANQVVPVNCVIQDVYGNVTTMDSNLTLEFTLTETVATTVYSAKLYSDSEATQELTGNKLVIAAGNTGGTAYLKDTEAENVTIAITTTPVLTPEPQSITITVEQYGTLAKLVFVQPPAQLTAGDTRSFTLQLQDAYGNAFRADKDYTVTLTAQGANADTVTWGGSGVTQQSDKLKATATISSGSSDLTFTFSDTKASDKVTITASIAEPALSATVEFKIVPAANEHFVVKVADAYPATGGIEINSDQRTEVTIEVQDKYGNPVPQASPLTVNLTSDSNTGNANFYADATSDTDITTVTITAGASSVTVYYYDKLRPEDGVQKDITISASAGIVTGSAPVTLMGPRPEKLEIAGDDSVEVNLRLPLTIRLLDQYGNPYAVAQNTNVTLTDNKDGEFYTSLVGGTSVPSVTIAAGKSEATVYYRPTSVGPNTVTAIANVAVEGTSGFNVQGTKSVTVRPAGQVANALSITAETITAGTTGEVSIKVTDQYGNPVAQSADLVVTLKADSPTGKFYDKAEGGTEISTVTIAKDKSETTVYYYDTKAGAQKITVSAPGLDPAEGTITVVPAEPAKIAVVADGSVVVNERAKITFTVVDRFDNPVAVDGSSLTLVLSSSSTTGRFEDESGKQITQVTVAEGQSSATAYYKDSTAGEVTITARTTGLEGSAKLTVQPVPAPDTTPPTVEGTDPQDKASGVAVDKVITVTFSEVVQRGNSFSQIVLKDTAGNPVDCDVALTGKVLTIGPKEKLAYSTTYTVIIPAGAVADLAGNALAQDYTLSFSTTMPTVTLKAGWNLVSLPLIPNEPSIGTVLASVYDKLGAVWSYDAVAGKWSSYAPGAPSSLTVMRDGKGYWVKVNGDCSFAVEGVEMPVGPQVPPSYELVPGWNLIGFKSTVPEKASEYLAAMAGKYTVIYGYDAATQRFHQVLAGENLQPGKGYWIAVTAPGYIYP